MPPSSRKRNKGKDRKAKQLAKKEESDRADSRIFWRSYSVTITGCNHGCDVIPAYDHPVSNFMDQFIINAKAKYKIMNVRQNLREIFKSHTQIFNNEDYKKLALDILTNIGTNMLLGRNGRGIDTNTSWPVCITQTIVVLEHYNGTGDVDSVLHKRVAASRIRDLQPSITSIRRDCLKFYRKRITCTCLKKMHLEARKTEPKTGICWYCDQEKERVLLSVCSRCMIEQYCSRECQVADWPLHKTYCNDYVEQRKMDEQMTQQND